MNLDKEFIPYEQALALKELGFDEPCFGYYGDNLELLWKSVYAPWINSERNLIDNNFCTAPTFSQAFRWFREKYKLIGLVKRDINRNYNGWWFEILSQIEEKYNPILLYSEDFNKDTYEEAELACLKKLIEIVKTK